MSDGTAIEWAEMSWNPIRARSLATGVVGHYCVKVSPGCLHCYAERLQAWPIGSGIRYAAQDRGSVDLYLDEAALEEPTRKKRGRDIFPCSMTDLFADFHPDEWIGRMFDVMYRTPQHRYQVLTKRAARMRDFIVGANGAGNNAFAFKNVWFGISAESQDAWNERAPFVDEMRSLGFNTWASCEPLLGEIDIGRHRVGWAVIGGESGPGARPTYAPHVRSLLRQFQRAGTRVFVKQLGANVRDRNDAGFDGCEPGSWPLTPEGYELHVEDDVHGYIERYQGAEVRVRLQHQKGGNPAEWPEDLRVRELPA